VLSLGIFSVVPPTEPYALRSAQPLKVSTRDFSWGKSGRCIWLTTYHPCSAKTSIKSGALTYPEPLGPPQPVAGHLHFTYFTLLLVFIYLQASLILSQEYVPEKHHTNQTQNPHLKHCTSWGITDWQPYPM